MLKQRLDAPIRRCSGSRDYFRSALLSHFRQGFLMDPVEGIRSKLYELCPEIKNLGIHPIVLRKGNRF